MLERLTLRDRIDLALEPAFSIGALHIKPAHLQVLHAGELHPVEPRVMQVLVLLAQADGRVVSRDELVDRCWDGRIVGENAIQRIMSRLRALGSTTGAFEVKAVTKVGYILRAIDAGGTDAGACEDADCKSLAEPETSSSPLPLSRQPTRRLLLGSALALSAAAIGAAVHRNLGASRNPDESAASELLAKAREAQLIGLPEQEEQAIAYLRRATEVVPRHAEAWGALSLAYQHQLENGKPDELPSLAANAADAGRRALALDQANVEAKVALATIPCNFRRWAECEERINAIGDAHGRRAVVECPLGLVRCDVGRWAEAVASFRIAYAAEPFHVGNRITLVRGLWGQGQLAEADRILADSLELWPRHRWIWRMRFDFLAITGRPGAALALMADPESRPMIPPGANEPPYEALAAFATAMETRSSDDLARAATFGGTRREPGPFGHHPMYLLKLDRVDEVFDLVEHRFFGGPGVPPPTPLDRRRTSFLFSSLARPMQSHPRYRPLLDRLGLTSYWRKTGTRPDFPV